MTPVKDQIAGQRPAWTSDVLDFLTVRTSAIFGDITPKSAPSLAAFLLRTEWETLLVSNILSSSVFPKDIEEVTRRAPRELRRVQASARRVSTHGLVRGRLLSRDTLLERIRQQDPTLWVVDPRRHVFQTIPNGALVGFLDHVHRVGSRLEGTAARRLPVSNGLSAIERLLRTWPLNEVKPDVAWPSIPLTADLMKVPTYALVGQWARTLSAARRRRDTDSLRSNLAGWLAEETNDRLFELYALSRTLTALHNYQDWENMTVLPSDLSFVAEGNGVRTTVLVDQSPGYLGRYNWLLNRYEGIDGRGRRPDLQLITTTHVGVRTTFIEAKETDPNDTYGRDSVVKVLGYLKDYEDIWPGEPVTYPRAVLLFSHPVRPRVPLTERVRDEVLLSSPVTFDDDLAAILSAHLG